MAATSKMEAPLYNENGKTAMSAARKRDSFMTACSSVSQEPTREDASNEGTRSFSQMPRVWKRAVVSSLQDTVSRIHVPPCFPRLERHYPSHEDDEPQWRASIQSGAKESFQTGVHFVTAPLRIIPIPSILRQSGSDSSETRQESRPLEKFRPFRRSRAAPVHPITRDSSILPIMSVREINATIAVPVYQQSSWDLAAILMESCSSGLETALALLLFLLPTSILLSWWRYFSDTWPIQWIYGYWLWIIHSLHSARHDAGRRQSQTTSTILAAGAALAMYNASMPPQPPRRDKRWRR